MIGEYESYTAELAKLLGTAADEPDEPNDGEPDRSIQFKGFQRIHPMWGGHHWLEPNTMERIIHNNRIGYGGGFEEDV